MGATGTVALGFDGLEVSDRDVVGVQTDEAGGGATGPARRSPPPPLSASPTVRSACFVSGGRIRAPPPRRGRSPASSTSDARLPTSSAEGIAGSHGRPGVRSTMTLVAAGAHRTRPWARPRPTGDRRARGRERRRCDVARASRATAESRGDVLPDPGSDGRSAGGLARSSRAFSLTAPSRNAARSRFSCPPRRADTPGWDEPEGDRRGDGRVVPHPRGA